MKQSCTPKYLFGIISRKWAYRIVRHLNKTRIFSELQILLPGITNRVLAGELRRLMKENIVLHEGRKYFLSPLGKKLLAAIKPLLAWGEEYKGLPHCPENQDCNRCVRHEKG